MDADLQDPPELVLEMIREYRRGYDVVYAQRTRRDGEGVFKRWSAWLFYRVMRLLVYKDLQPDVGDFRLISRRCLDALRQMRETHRFLRGMVTWVGFPQTGVPFVRAARAAGKTKYSFGGMIRFAWSAALSFSPLPLRLSLIGGALILCIGLAYGLYGSIEYVLGRPLVRGWFSLIVLNCLGWGTTIMAIGILGEYVARIYEEIKGRPLYFIADTWNLDK
jgi:dolichol-phosphate mannosyltransferase